MKRPSSSSVVGANTYHYIVNNKYARQYNYHLRISGESLRLICYDGLIIDLFKDDDTGAVVITIGGSPSCQYSFPAQYRGLADISVLLDSPIAKYEKKHIDLY